jgi:hypothetical protein
MAEYAQQLVTDAQSAMVTGIGSAIDNVKSRG